MFELFYLGGPLFMGILTLIFVAMIIVSFINGLPVLKGYAEIEKGRNKISYIKSVGLFALIIGILGQLIGLFEAFKAIEQVNDISPAMMAGGLKVSMITTLYGLFIYAISFLIWFGLSLKLKK
jgi:biopolymer transport protein ExbB/TolQ